MNIHVSHGKHWFLQSLRNDAGPKSHQTPVSSCPTVHFLVIASSTQEQNVLAAGAPSFPVLSDQDPLAPPAPDSMCSHWLCSCCLACLQHSSCSCAQQHPLTSDPSSWYFRVPSPTVLLGCKATLLLLGCSLRGSLTAGQYPNGSCGCGHGPS